MNWIGVNGTRPQVYIKSQKQKNIALLFRTKINYVGIGYNNKRGLYFVL